MATPVRSATGAGNALSPQGSDASNVLGGTPHPHAEVPKTPVPRARSVELVEDSQDQRVLTPTQKEMSQEVQETAKEHSPAKSQVTVPGDVDMELAEVPDIRDLTAPKPKLGVPQISNAAIYQRSYRIFQPRANGTRKVSQTIYDEWHGKGAPRKTLELIFQQCGWDPVTRLKAWFPAASEATFITEVEILREEMKESELQIEGEFLTPEVMEERGYSECLGITKASNIIRRKCFDGIQRFYIWVKAVPQPRKRIEAIKTHCRTDPRKLMRPGLLIGQLDGFPTGGTPMRRTRSCTIARHPSPAK